MSTYLKDTGHYNCRDYPQAESSTWPPLQLPKGRADCSSPMNEKIHKLKAFAFFSLPLELRRKVYSYLLPYAKPRPATSIRVLPLVPSASEASTFRTRSQPVIWEHGQTNLLCVSQRMHDECAALIYGTNTFVLFTKYSGTTFRHQWLLSSGLAPTLDLDFLEQMPARYLGLIRRVSVSIDHPDSYTGMIKFNVGGKGLTHGVRHQVQRLVKALTRDGSDGPGLSSLHIRLINGNEYLDAEKRACVHARDVQDLGRTEDVQSVLEPFARLRGVNSIEIEGAVTSEYASVLSRSMKE